jgi:NAD(P)-dependent dehydrogenase (short-subunit alcohol dehydrogenase family)
LELTLQGKTALITGASRGIGRAIAQSFADAGAAVMLTARHAESLERAAKEITDGGGIAGWYPSDVGDNEQAVACSAATIDRFGRIDILVNNAGTSPTRGPLVDVDYDLAMRTVQVNQAAPLVWATEAWRASMRDHGGVVINITSLGGIAVYPNAGWYSATKAATMRLTEQLAYELAPGVRVNAIAPGVVKTDFGQSNEEEYRFSGKADQLGRTRTDEVAQRLPLRRLGVPRDVASAALFLASDEASWITGQTLVVDGGALVIPWRS